MTRSRYTVTPDPDHEAVVDAVIDATRPTWRARAACLHIETTVFFGHDRDEAATAVAKAICASCPVRDECRAWATAHVEQGIWGGLTETEREQLPRYRPVQRCPTCRVKHRPDNPAVRYCSDECRQVMIARSNRSHMAAVRATG